MTSAHRFLEIIYIAWAVILLVTAALKRGSEACRACLVAALGFGMLIAYLYTSEGPAQTTVRALAFAVLLYAGWLSFRGRGRQEVAGPARKSGIPGR